MTDELVAVLEQVGAELATCTRQAMQRVEVELAGELANNAVSSAWSAINAPSERTWPLSCTRFELTDNSSVQLKIH